MRFLAPALLLGILAAALPYLIHRVGKRRALPVRFAAMQLLLRSERRVQSRRKLREILLMLARTAVAASLPFIFARPFSERATDLPVVTLDSQAAVIILDDSASMQRSSGGGTLFGRARARAQALARQFPSDSELAFLVTSAGSPPRIGELEPDRTRVIEAIESTRCSARPADFTSAMRHVYIGNLRDDEGESTFCTGCGERLIGRKGYEVTLWALTETGNCKACGTRCVGRFDGGPGAWGNRRLPIAIHASE